MIKNSIGETPFSLTCGTEAVIPAEKVLPSRRIQFPDVTSNDQELRLNLELLEGRREMAAIREAKYKRTLEQHYNAEVRPQSFKVGEYVFRSNEASRSEPSGKLGPNWEGPYEIIEAHDKGSYMLAKLDGTPVPRTWNGAQLRRCYL
jgi:polynucleotide 5'-kinase involved in rRNA processing